MARKNIDIAELNLDGLLALRDELDARIAQIAESEVAALEEKLAALKPYTRQSVKPTTKSRKPAGTRSKLPPKFRDPASGKTWSGRGMTPVWLREYEAQGKSREEFAI